MKLRKMDKNKPQSNSAKNRNQRGRSFWRSPSKLVITTTVLVLLGCATIWAYYAGVFTSKNESDSSQTDTSGNAASSGEQQSEVTPGRQAFIVAEEKGYDAGQEALDVQVANSSDDQMKADLYITKSNLAGSLLGGNNRKLALEYAYMAEALMPSTVTASTVASLEQISGNNANALKYYKLMEERFTEGDKSAYPDDYRYLLRTIKSLEAAQ